MNASKALAAIARNDALSFRRMTRPTSAVAFAGETYTEPEPAANGRFCHAPRINLVAQRRFKGQADGKNGEEAVLAVARAGKKRHPYHRRRRGGQGVRVHANGTPV